MKYYALKMLFLSISGKFPCLGSPLKGNYECEFMSYDTGTLLTLFDSLSITALNSSSFAYFLISNSSLIFLHCLHFWFWNIFFEWISHFGNSSITCFSRSLTLFSCSKSFEVSTSSTILAFFCYSVIIALLMISFYCASFSYSI